MADQGRQGGSAHLNHPPLTHSTAQSSGRGLKGAARKRKKRPDQPQSEGDSIQASAQSRVSTDPSPSDSKRLRIGSVSSNQLYGFTEGNSTSEPPVANAIRKRKTSSSRKGDSFASTSKKIQISSRVELFSSLEARGNDAVEVGASSSVLTEKERRAQLKLDKKRSSSGSNQKPDLSASGEKSLPSILTTFAASSSSALSFSTSGSSFTSQKKCSSSSLPSCSTFSGPSGESTGGGSKKLVSRYSLRSKGTAKSTTADTTGSTSNQPSTANATVGSWTVVPLGSRKRPAQSDSAVSGNFSGSTESWDNSSTGKGHRRTLATTGSCTSSSRRWGGGGGGAVPNTSSGSKGADCSNMSDDQPNACENPTPSGGNGNGASGGVDSESDDSDVGRLQALLEARGLPPHLFGALAPRMHHLLHRTIGTTSTTTKAQQLLQGLQATSDEGRQMQAVIEMCQMLVMGNEDTLAGFPVKQVVPALIVLLNMEHNFDMMNHACRALTYMMEALPRSSAVVLDALPVFLEKLQAIQCMDVAEQSLTALEMLSRRHSKAILQARGVWACLMYLDFFSINAQRAALAITAKCCQNLLPEELHLVQQSIPLLSSRLTQQDQKSLESVCLALSRLVESLQDDPPKLLEIASPELLTNLQQLLTVSPPLINTGTFITVVRMLTTMCSSCPELALTLLKNNIAETLCYLLTGRADTTQGEIELVARSPQEVYEMTCLISELMPRLPQHALFAVDALLDRPNARTTPETVSWQWRDDMGVWHAYTPLDSRIIEAAHQTGEDETSLSNLGRTYTVDFQTMQQINEDTGTSRPIERRVIRPQVLTTNSSATNNNTSVQESSIDNDLKDVAGSFIRSLFSVLYEVYSSSAGPAVRCKCLKALLRMVYFASPELLKDVLKAQTVSSQLAGMMASQDLRIVVSALQIAEILVQKLPDIFSVHFTREGVIHEIKQLADPGVPLGASPTKVSPQSTVPPVNSNISAPGPSTSTPNGAVFLLGSSSTTPESPQEELFMNVTDDETALSDCSPISRRMKDLRKQKRTSKRDKHSTKAAQQQQPSQVTAPAPASSEGSGDVPSSNSFSWSTRYTRARRSTSKTPNFLASLNPARWGRATSERNYHKTSGSQKIKESCSLSKCSSSSNLWAGNREKVRAWVRERAGKFVQNFASNDSSVSQDPSKILFNLTQAISVLQSSAGDKRAALTELRDTLMSCDISPFEVNHSGLVKALLQYLAVKDNDRSQRIRTFLNVFAKCPPDENGRDSTSIDPTCFQVLVSKLNSCISQLEQFPVKVHDLPAPAGSTTALKFFNTHQLKCQLARHPDCSNLKQWKGGSVKIDPLAQVQAIERYLVVRGFGKVRDKHSSQSDDENSEEDIDDSLVGVVAGTRHKLQFLINDTVLPYNMTVYQAVRQFSPAAGGASDQSETDTDSEAPLGPASIWVQTHIVHYRPVIEDEVPNKSSSVSAAPRKGKSGCKSTKKKQDELWLEGSIPKKLCPMDRYLVSDLSSKKVTISDASLSVLCLLNALHTVSVHWHSLYPAIQGRPILPQLEFINNKIAAKAGRQLQDPLVIMTGNLPGWLQQIAAACPFLLPFETRQLLLYATAFDRDRALQRLLDAAPELSGAADSERVTPRLERRKRTVSRDDILKQAETLIQDMATSKALLEVQYENEVGTGLGPTLEFYALVSRELQRSDLELWHDDSGAARQDGFVSSTVGLFPAPIARSTRVSQVVKLRNKFKFIGKFMAKAVMDSRMLDLPLSPTFFRWLLTEESSLGLADLAYVNPSVHKTLVRLMAVVAQFKDLMASDIPEDQKKAKIEALELDGCPIEALSLDFTLPGYPQIEMRKGGKDMTVTPHNLEQYISLVVHWYLVEGVQRQMESVREGMQVVFSTSHLGLFYPTELDAIFCGSSTGWEVSALMESCRPDHGYSSTSRAIKFLFDILSSYGPVDQRDFVQFITGSPRLPVGGFKALSPPLTIVRKTIDGIANADDFLPSVMTCVNYLKLPDYSTLEIMREKLRIAAKEGQCSFHLS